MMFDTSKRKPDYPLLTAVGILVPLGLVMVYSASFVDAFTNHGNQLYYALRQLMGVVIGTIGLLVAQRIDYRFWRNYSVQLIGASLLLLLVVLILPASITEVNGARQWIRLGPLSMQPSEIIKFTMIVYFADWLSRRGQRLDNVSYGLVPFAVMLGVVCGLVMLEGDLGTTIVLIIIAGVVYFTAGANKIHILGASAVAAGAFWAMVNIAPFRQGRIAAWLDPFSDYLGAGWQPVHGLYALGSGGLFGVGLGQGRQKFLWLSQAHTDAIFAVIGEEFGLIGTLFVVGCFLMIAYRGLRIAARAPDPFAALLATGLTGWLVFQALINVAVVTTLLPFTGLTLPFISYGSSSLIMCMVATGVLLSISRHTVDRQSEKIEQAPRASRRSPIALGSWLAAWRKPKRRGLEPGRKRRERNVTGPAQRSARSRADTHHRRS